MAFGQCLSYPKSGRSWLRYMLEVAGCEDALDFHHDGFEFNDGARPAHDFAVARRLDRYPACTKIIYLERDPRDVLVSLYYQITGRFRDFYGYTGDISSFIRDPYFGAQTLAKFRGIWKIVLAERPFLIVRYEDMYRNTRHELERVVSYLELNVSVHHLEKAIVAGGFETMRELEQSGAHRQPWLRLRNGSPKVRRGQVGGFRTELQARDIAYLDEIFDIKC